MFLNRLVEAKRWPTWLVVQAAAKHNVTCPAKKKPEKAAENKSVCKAGKPPGKGSGKPPDKPDVVVFGPLRRAEKSGKCRLLIIPEEWFLFFYPQTGVTGPYIFGLVLVNYWLSKEIFVMEHEYYTGLSWILMVYIVVTKLGPGIATALDKEVDDIAESWEKGRRDEIASNEAIVKAAKNAVLQAGGQKLLMDAKKENVLMQLEAIYRERRMHVYNVVKGRMDYHIKKHNAESRIHQKWMIGWILENVMKSITPDFEKRALDQAIQDLAAAANRAS